MAVTSEALDSGAGAAIYPFPTAAAHARTARPPRRRAARQLALGLVAVVAVVLLLASGSGPGAASAGHRHPGHVTIRPGQTLWDLAARFGPPDGDPRAYVDALIELNDLSGPLQPGVRLRLP